MLCATFNSVFRQTIIPSVASLVLLLAGHPIDSFSSARSEEASGGKSARQQSSLTSKPAGSTVRLQQTRQRVLQMLAEAEAKLQAQPDFDFADCQKCLRWDELRQEVANDLPNVGRLQELACGLYGFSAMLEQPSLIGLRKPMAHYIEAAILAGIIDLPAAHKWHLDRITTLLAEPPGKRDENELRRHIAWMDWIGEVPEFTRQARQRATHPNFIVAIRKDLLRPYLRELDKKVTETKFSTNIIVGALVSGNVQTQGTVQSRFDFTSNVPKIRVTFRGSLDSPHSQAVSGPVTLQNTGHSSFEATTDVKWNGRKLLASPTVARCSTHSNTFAAQANRTPLIPIFSGRFLGRIIENIALRRAGEERTQAERESNQIAQRKISNQMNIQIAETIEGTNAHIEKYLVKPFSRIDFRPVVRLASTPDHVALGLTQYDAASMAADRPPAWKPMAGRAILGLHQSALTSFTRKSSGGALWHDNEIADLQRLLMGVRSKELDIDDRPRWALQLDWLQPFSARIDPEGVQITIRAQALTYNDKTLECPIRIVAKYKLQASGTTLQGQRQGEIEVATLEKVECSEKVRQRIIRFLETKFSAFFRDRIYYDGLTMPTGEHWNSLARFYVREVQLQPGWIYLAIDNAESGNARLVKQQRE
jgi:hypothetical protein